MENTIHSPWKSTKLYHIPQTPFPTVPYSRQLYTFPQHLLLLKEYPYPNEIVFTYVTEVGSISVNNENVTYRTETHEGILYQIFESQEVGIDSSIVWDMNGYGFLINGEYPVDELIKMAVSVE